MVSDRKGNANSMEVKMSEERRRIQDLLSEGKISAAEAERLFDALLTAASYPSVKF